MTATVGEAKSGQQVETVGTRVDLLDRPSGEPVSEPAAPRPAPPPVIQQPTRVLERSHWQRRYSSHLRLTDTAAVIGAVVLAQYVRFGDTPALTGWGEYAPTVYSVVLAGVWLTSLAVMRTRCSKYVGVGIDEYRRVTGACVSTFWIVAVVELVFKLQFSRAYLAVAFPVGLVTLLFSRWMWRKYVSYRRTAGLYHTAVLVIGEREAVETLTSELTADAGSGYDVVGVCIAGGGDSRGQHLTVGGRRIPIVGGVEHAATAVRDCDADTVAIAGTGRLGVQEVRRLIWQLDPMGVDLLVSPGVMDIAPSRMVMRPVASLPLLHIAKPQYRGAKRIEKRLFDVACALFALSVTMPILVAVAIAIKVTSRGPVFYASERIGIDGKPFYMLKFRTMVVDADKQCENLLQHNDSDGLLFKIRNDPRVTPVGRILRRFSLDELPQFINVLRRDMSVVGPRPPLRREVERYDGDVRRRLLVKPGITGLWQISGRSDLSWDRAVRLDLSYVDNWSMAGDIVIIAKTMRAVLRHEGAY